MVISLCHAILREVIEPSPHVRIIAGILNLNIISLYLLIPDEYQKYSREMYESKYRMKITLICALSVVTLIDGNVIKHDLKVNIRWLVIFYND